MGCLNTSLCYIERDGCYLMLHRTKKKQDPNAGKWIGVGSKFEAGESPEECAIREVAEETGLTLTSLCLRGIVTFVSDAFPTEYMFLFTADQFTGELCPCDEGELAWIEKKRVLSLPLWEGDRVFLRLLREERPFFSLKLSYQGDALVSAVLDGKTMDLSETR
ncbi:MAG: 8-oxo-dGTP diphosphatase [Clostridia bacterium]|nr:8-oxo-dGTP diphosphatase [Clostridia bacterium]